ncbi:hypothetical protein Chor_005715 [Crotalus horridus]
MACLVCFAVSQKIPSKASSSSKAALRQLSDYLFANYKKDVRPVWNWRKTTNVAIDVMIYAILSVDEKNQVLTTYIWYRQHWIDEFLKWNPEDFDNITQMSIPTEAIWVPDILINEFVDVGKSPEIPYVYILYNGEVRNLKPVQVVTACSLDIYNFPFDVQNCSLTFTSWLHNIRDINLSLWRTPEEVKTDRSVFMNQGEWELLHVLSQFREFSVGDNDYYAEMKFFVSCWGIYFVVCMALLVISLTETILIVRLVHKQDLQPHVPDWVKRWVLERATILLCIQDRKAFHPVCTQSSNISRNIENNDSTAKLNHYSCDATRDFEGRTGAVTDPLQGESPESVAHILQEIAAIRQFLEKRDEFRDIACEWLQVGYVLDVLLFRAYLVAVLAYSITLGTLWSIWQYA